MTLTLYWVFSLTWPACMQIYWNKRKRLHKKRVQLPEDWFGTPTWPPFHCFGAPIWPPWRHVKTLYWSCVWWRTKEIRGFRSCVLSQIVPSSLREQRPSFSILVEFSKVRKYRKALWSATNIMLASTLLIEQKPGTIRRALISCSQSQRPHLTMQLRCKGVACDCEQISPFREVRKLLSR